MYCLRNRCYSILQDLPIVAALPAGVDEPEGLNSLSTVQEAARPQAECKGFLKLDK